MRSLTVFILLLANSWLFQLNACGFYPWGEEVRFCYMKPKYFNYDAGYSYFNYTTDWYDMGVNYYNEDDPYNSGTGFTDPNVELWGEYCAGKVAARAIDEAVYELKIEQLQKSSNAMVRYLKSVKDNDALEYLKFAKQAEYYSNNEDPWEKRDSIRKASPAKDLIELANKRASVLSAGQLQRRYKFQEMRLAFYSGNMKVIKDVFEGYFSKLPSRDLIYYWAMFFYTQIQDDPVKENYFAAQVFANAPDKRFVVRSNYDRTIPVKETLEFCTTPQEAANVWLLEGIRSTGKGLPYLQQIYKNNPESEGLGFMLLREVNKLEDWVLTPYYSLFEPSTRRDYWENNNARRILNRVKEDRKYAAEVLRFAEQVDFNKTANPQQWRIARAYLAFLAGNATLAHTRLSEAETAYGNDDQYTEVLKLLRGLILVSGQEKGNAGIPAAVEPIIMEQCVNGNFKYIFGLGRELEEKGNSTLAALLYSKINYEFGVGEWTDNSVHWKARNDIESMYSDYYWEYRSYIDATYTILQVQKLISDLEGNKLKTGFYNWLSKEVRGEKYELYRILGTKYLRENKLAEARDAFAKIETMHQYIFPENPFYKLKDTPEFTADYDKRQKVTRQYIAGTLLEVLQKANDPGNANRDYYYFLAANCEFNMSYYGNAWNMRRRFISSGQSYTYFNDDPDFFAMRSASKYYGLAYKYAKNEKFKALCLQMMSRCEELRLNQQYESNWFYNDRHNLKKGRNVYDEQLKKQFAPYYEDLAESNCSFVSDYFKARN